MKILYITDALAIWGGIERVLCDKVNYLVCNPDYEVFIVTSDQGTHPIPFFLGDKTHVIDLDIRSHRQYQYGWFMRIIKYFEYDRLYKKRLKDCINSITPDVISCLRDGYVKSVLSVKGDIPLIFESHSLCRDIEIENATFLHRFVSYLSRRKFKKLDRIVTLTEGDANDWRKYCNRITIIPNVVHLNTSGHFSTCINKNVVFAGRFDVQKDIGSLIAIWQIVQQRHNDWVLNVYGNGELKLYYHKMVQELKLNIKIHPATSDIFDIYKDSSMLLMTSLYEPFGLVLVEAMSCGLPVVAFNCPYGPADIITEGKDGFLIEGRDINAYADKVCLLIENVELRQKMGQAAIISSKRYDKSCIMHRWETLFEELSC
jgi:glycosyltransferase involved in cell wall biosynthesis